MPTILSKTPVLSLRTSDFLDYLNVEFGEYCHPELDSGSSISDIASILDSSFRWNDSKNALFTKLKLANLDNYLHLCTPYLAMAKIKVPKKISAF